MENALSSLKKQYNEELEHFYKAANHMDDMDVPIKKRETWIPKFREIFSKLGDIQKEIEKELGREVTEDEIINGFKE